MEINDFGSRLVQWYLLNRRDLPWRTSKDPYFVWLSEIILQQTRVEQGLPYYEKFVKAFPSVFHLAEASEQKVLSLWQGLGYYSRARNLHAAAKIVANSMDGNFPSSAEGLQKLPGIGPYTASAMASICFDEETAVVDGNVYRLISRVFGITDPIDLPKGQKSVRRTAQLHLKGNNPGDFNQAMMEFGALQCTPHNPNCMECIFQSCCQAYLMNDVGSLPVKQRKTNVQVVYFHYLVISFKGQWLFKKRTTTGIWKNMFDFPCVEHPSKLDIASLFDQKETQFLKPINFELHGSEIRATHLLSHRRIFASFISLSLDQLPTEIPDNYLWLSKNEFQETPMPQLINKFLASNDKFQE